MSEATELYALRRIYDGIREDSAEYEKDDPHCGNCDYYHPMGEYPAECACDGDKPMMRPPLSWCYVKEDT